MDSEKSRNTARPVLFTPKPWFGRAAADFPGDRHHGRHTQKDDERHPETVVKHDAQHTAQQDHAADHGRDRLGDQLAQGVDIICVVAHDIAVLVGVKIADGQVLHLCEHLLTHFVQKTLSDHCHQLTAQKTGQQGDHIKHRQKRDLRNDQL